MRRWKHLIATGVAALGCLAARASWAQDGGAVPSCSNATMFPNPIYLSGSTAYQPTAATFGGQMSGLTDASLKATIIYNTTAGVGSCDGAQQILDGVMLSGTAVAYSPNPSSTDPTNVTKTTCTLDGTTKADVGISDIFWPNCPNLTSTPQPATIKDVQGPVQAMIFIVPAANTTFTKMSAEQAQLIWGCGPGGMIAPFDDVTGIMQRSATSGTQGIVAKAIQVPPTGFFGVANGSGGALVTALTMYASMHDPTKAIGFLAGDAFEQAANRPLLNPVAFQAFHQSKAYYADSSNNAKDRKNVRDGHYVVWGPEHFFVNVDSSGTPTSAGAKKFIGATTGTMYQSSFDYVQLQSLAGVIPQCAMKVTRSDDGAPVTPSIVADPCGCFYEKTRTGATTCTACVGTGTSTCTGGLACHHGFCE
jgi:hypothetical protein